MWATALAAITSWRRNARGDRSEHHSVNEPTRSLCTRGQARTICDVCDSDRMLVKFVWHDRLIDLCQRCTKVYADDAEWRLWADQVIARNLATL